MSRIRTVKPEFFTSEQVAECSPTARLLFIGLWCFCDDQGVHPDSMKRIKMEVFPADESITSKHISGMITELINQGLMIRYRHENQSYLWVTGWKHQKIDKPTIRYPSPNDPRSLPDTSPSTTRTLDNPSGTESSLRESSLVETKILSDRRMIDETGFDVFWQHYPRKVGKGGARKSYRAALTKTSPETLLAAIKAHASEMAGKDETFIPHPATWLNQERWMDQHVASTGNGHLRERRSPREPPPVAPRVEGFDLNLD